MGEFQQAIENQLYQNPARGDGRIQTAPLYESEARNRSPVSITSGEFAGLTGTIQEIRRTENGYAYGIADLPNPANPNRLYWYMESQLCSAGYPQTYPRPSSTVGPASAYPPSSTAAPSSYRFEQQVSLLDMVSMEIRNLREEMAQLKGLVHAKLGTIQVHVTYHQENTDDRNAGDFVGIDNLASASSLPLDPTPKPNCTRTRGRDSAPETAAEPVSGESPEV